MKVNREVLLKTLQAVKPGLSTKEVVEQSTSFVFKAGQVITFNDEVAVHAQVQEELNIEGAVPAKELIGILSRFTGDEVAFKLQENELRLTCGKGRAGIRLEAEITLPVHDIITLPEKWKKLPADFKAGLGACLASAATDMTYPILTCLYLTNQHAEASDGNQIARYTWAVDCPGLKKGVLLPASAAKEITKMNPKGFAITDEWAHFQSEAGVVLSCRLGSGDFPELDGHLIVEAVGVLEFPAQVREILDRAGVFLSGMIERDNTVKITIDGKGLMTIEGEGDSGWYAETCRAKWSGEEVAFNLHPVYLQKILDTTNKAQVGEDRILFQTESFAHVVALEAV